MQKLIIHTKFIKAVGEAEQFEIENRDDKLSILITFVAHNNAQEEVSKPCMNLLKLMTSFPCTLGEIDGMAIDVQEVNTTFSEEVDKDAYPIWAKCTCVATLR